MLRQAGMLVTGVVASLIVAVGASADPTGSKNSLSGTAQCDNGASYQFVTNSANGQGSGSQNQNTAPWAPAHFVGTNDVFHPSVFDITFTFTPAGGSPESFTNTSSRKNGVVSVTCSISASQTDSAGDTFTLSGTVSGWIS